MVRFVPATQDYIDAMKGNIRDIDCREVYAVNHMTINQALQISFDSSSLCWVILNNEGVPVCAFGVSPESFASDKASVWLLATPQLEPIAKHAAKQSRKFIDKMLKKYTMLENWVHADNKTSIMWLAWCGFNIERAETYGIEKEKFHRFWKLKGGC